MFILSGLRFAVLADIERQRRWPKITLDCKLMLSGTLALILVAWVLFALLEWRNPATLAGLDSTGARI